MLSLEHPRIDNGPDPVLDRRCPMVLAQAAMLQALGYCVDDEPSVWPPDRATVGPSPELTVTRADSERLWLRAQGELFELEVVWTGDGQQSLRPTRPLPMGQVELVGFVSPVRWTVTDAPVDPPRWRSAPSIASMWGFGFLCPQGPFVNLLA